MHAIILAAGYATRMYPLTENTPKPLLRVGDKSIVDHIIEKIPKEVKKIHIVTNAKFYNQFKVWQKNKKNISIVNDATTSNEARLEGIGDILLTIKGKKIDDDLLIIAGDNLFEFDLQKMLDMFKEKNTPIIAASDLKDKSLLAKRFGVIQIGKSDKMIGFEEKPENPKTKLAATACYVIPKTHIPKLRQYTKEIKEKKNLGYFIIWLMQKEPVHAVVFKEPWYDIGNLEEYNKLKQIYKYLVKNSKQS